MTTTTENPSFRTLNLPQVPVLPDSAPFSSAQRAWLNGLFAGLLGGGGNGSTPETAAAASVGGAKAPAAPADAKPQAAVRPSVRSVAHGRDNPFPARLRENRRLNLPGSEKDTRHVALDLTGSGLTYKPGDALGVYPEN